MNKLSSQSSGNTFQNKINDVNSDIINLNRKFQNFESLYEKLNDDLNEETQLRQNIEKKTFQINESFNNKFNTLSKGFEDLTAMMSTQVEDIRVKFLDEMENKNQIIFKKFEDYIKKVENCEKKNNDVFMEMTLLKSDNNSKFLQLQEIFQKEISILSKDLNNSNLKIELLEKKVNDNNYNIQNDLSDLIKDFKIFKNDIEIVKNFKENTILNFKDISEEFIKNDENMSKMSNCISVNLQEFESKIKNFDQTFNLQCDNLNAIKKDVYSQLHENNSNINLKIQKLNENLFNRLDLNEKSFDVLQNSLINENEKFTHLLTDQLDQNYKNLKKLVDYSNEDLSLIKNKSNHLEEMIKNLRNEFFTNLTEMEEFLTRKYEDCFRSITPNRDRF